ncbi:hypothetical protein JCM18899A_14420 [Nocardioides sp. AN3]
MRWRSSGCSQIPHVRPSYTEGGLEVTACGELGTISAGSLHVKVADNTTTTTKDIPLTSVTALKQVASCGG